MTNKFETGVDRFIQRALPLKKVKESGEAFYESLTPGTSTEARRQALSDFWSSRLDLMARIAGIIWVAEAAIVVGLTKFS